MTALKDVLRSLADKYEIESFISSDPIKFPHRYKNKKDIEISGFVTSWISYGNRKSILAKAEFVDALFSGSPYNYIINGDFGGFKDDSSSFYRFYKFSDLYFVFDRLRDIYINYSDMEDAVCSSEGKNMVRKLQSLFRGLNGVPSMSGDSACKRLSMFLRWMVRQNSCVDLGIWHNFSQKDLVIPLDTHVFQQASRLGITSRKTLNMLTAIEITRFFDDVFPDDPARADFALFGYGVNKDEALLL